MNRADLQQKFHFMENEFHKVKPKEHCPYKITISNFAIATVIEDLLSQNFSIAFPRFFFFPQFCPLLSIEVNSQMNVA